MSQQLIPTFTGELAGAIQPLVNARDLHAFLGVGKDFSNWIKDRIEKYGFIDGEDYSPILANRSFGFGKPKTDYHLALDMAKELAMLENNERGRQARRYFIAVEKAAQEMPAVFVRPGQVEALQRQRLHAELLAAKPEWKALARYHAMGTLTLGEMGKLIGKSGEAVRHHLLRMSAAGLIRYTPDPQRAELGRRGHAIAMLGKGGAA